MRCTTLRCIRCYTESPYDKAERSRLCNRELMDLCMKQVGFEIAGRVLLLRNPQQFASLESLSCRNAVIDCIAVLCLPATLNLVYARAADYAALGLSDPVRLYAVHLILGLSGSVILAHVLTKGRGLTPGTLGLSFVVDSGTLFWGIVGGAAAITAASLIDTLGGVVGTLLEGAGSPSAPSDDVLDEDIATVSIMTHVVFLLLSAGWAVVYELIFRGLLIPRLHRLFGSWWISILTSSALNGLSRYDLGFDLAFTVACTGVVCGWVFVVSRSLVASVVARVLLNSVPLFLAVLNAARTAW